MYCVTNFKTKKALKTAVAEGRSVRVYQPGPFGDPGPKNGRIALEGPHYPDAHAWYASAVVLDGLVVRVS